jgi:hypothetical protein
MVRHRSICRCSGCVDSDGWHPKAAVERLSVAFAHHYSAEPGIHQRRRGLATFLHGAADKPRGPRARAVADFPRSPEAPIERDERIRFLFVHGAFTQKKCSSLMRLPR